MRVSKPPPRASETVEVRTPHGMYKGFRANGITTFKGIPYCHCERFKLPQPIEDAGYVDCTSFGPASPQPLYGPRNAALAWWKRQLPVIPEEPLVISAEQGCLTLNLFVPEGQGPFPVFFFIHGGGFLYGSSSNTTNRRVWRSPLVRNEGVAVVTINYRLGPFGFMKLPDCPANLGIHDAIAALQWVHKEGPHFSLAVDAVTIAGESAGAMLTGALLRAPSAQALFVRAVPMSGTHISALSLSEAEAIGQEFAKRVDIHKASTNEMLQAANDMGVEKLIVEMLVRAKEKASMPPDLERLSPQQVETLWKRVAAKFSANQIAGQSVATFGAMLFQPCTDGDLLLDTPCATGKDVLCGVCDNEYLTFMPVVPFLGPGLPEAREQFQDFLSKSWMDCRPTLQETDAVIETVKQEFGLTSGRDVCRRLLGCMFFEVPLVMSANELKSSNRVFVYRNMMGPGHAGELGFIFGTWREGGLDGIVMRNLCGLPQMRPWATSQLGESMEQRWGSVLGSFVRTGLPSETWPLFADNGLAVALHPAGEEVVPAASRVVKQCSILMQRATNPWPFGLMPRPQSRL